MVKGDGWLRYYDCPALLHLQTVFWQVQGRVTAGKGLSFGDGYQAQRMVAASVAVAVTLAVHDARFNGNNFTLREMLHSFLGFSMTHFKG